MNTVSLYSSTSVILLILLSVQLPLSAQGEWIPEGQRPDRPRLLLHPDEISIVRYRIDDPATTEGMIYEHLWEDVRNDVPPVDTVNISAQSTNATLAKNIAFILLIDSLSINGTWQPIPSDVRETLRSRLRTTLQRIDPALPEGMSDDDLLARIRQLTDYLAAWDVALVLELSEPVMDSAAEKLQGLTGALYRYGINDVGGESWFARRADHHALALCGGLGAAAVVLNDRGSSDTTEQPVRWINAALWWTDNLLWRAENRLSERAGHGHGYADGPHLMRTAFISLLPFFRSLGAFLPEDMIWADWKGETRSIPHPHRDTSMNRLYVWIDGIMEPDGTLPTIGEGVPGEIFHERILSSIALYPTLASEEKLVDYLDRASPVDMRANYLATGKRNSYYDIVDASSLLFHQEQTDGLQIIRPGGEDPKYPAWTLGLRSRNERSKKRDVPFGQGDAGSFYLSDASGGLALDPGASYETGVDTLASAQLHNLVLVDGEGPWRSNEEWLPEEYSQVDRSALLRERYGFGSIWSLRQSYVRHLSRYGGADVARHLVTYDATHAFVIDLLDGEESHEYTWQLHGFTSGEENFSFDQTDGFALWSEDGRSLSADVFSSSEDQTFETSLDPHLTSAGELDTHATLRLSTSPTDDPTIVLAALRPESMSAGDFYRARRIDEGALQMDFYLTKPGRDPWEDPPAFGLMTVSADTSVRSFSSSGAPYPFDLTMDGTIAGVSYGIAPFIGDTAYVWHVTMINGTSLSLNGRTVIRAPARSDVLISHGLASVYEPTIVWFSDSGTYLINPMSQTGFSTISQDNIVIPWEHAGEPGLIRITVDRPGYVYFTNPISVPDDRSRLRTGELSLQVGIFGEHLRYSFSSPVAEGFLALYTVDGRHIFSNSLNERQGSCLGGEVSVADVSPGIYVFQVVDRDSGRRGSRLIFVP